jgi:hypothetical protein
MLANKALGSGEKGGGGGGGGGGGCAVNEDGRRKRCSERGLEEDTCTGQSQDTVKLVNYFCFQ